MPVIYVNKPKGYTSFDVCAKLRKVFMTSKIGHTGTLDPNATGVLIVLVDNATKANQFLVTDTKEYVTTVKIGVRTDTLDKDGKILEVRECTLPNNYEIYEAFKSFLGKTKQQVPMTSAIKINGKKLYEYQRQNIEIDPPIRDIEVFELELLTIGKDSFSFKARVSSGTYIRALARDICEKFGVIGTVIDLKRTAVDNIRIEDCDSLDDVLNKEYHEHDLYDVLSLKYECYETNTPEDIRNGKRITINSKSYRILISYQKKALAIYERDGIEYRCVRGLE